MAETPHFGPMIRATRLGWGYSRQHGCFVRMSDVPPNEFRIELCPPNGVPGIKTPGRSHRVWWEDGQDVLAMLPWLKQVRAIKRYINVVVDENGTIVRAESSDPLRTRASTRPDAAGRGAADVPHAARGRHH